MTPSSAQLFSPFTLRSVTFRNRIAVSPMCQYSARDGRMDDWHLVHLGSRAAGGAGLVVAEAAAVLPEGRIGPGDLGLYDDAQIEPLARVFAFVAAQGATSVWVSAEAPGTQGWFYCVAAVFETNEVLSLAVPGRP